MVFREPELWIKLRRPPCSRTWGRRLQLWSVPADDFMGCQEWNDVEQADAEQTYAQAPLHGPETWVQIPQEHWPQDWVDKGFIRPVIRLLQAPYGHPDSCTFWEQKCDAHCRSVGFEPIPVWPSCYFHDEFKCLLITYVDGFKIAGPTKALPVAWGRLNEGLVIGKVCKASHFLGCTDEKGQFTFPGGKVVVSMTNNMEPFMKSCVDRYFFGWRTRFHRQHAVCTDTVH